LHYVGQELDVFAAAVGWKRYVRERLSRYIGGKVLEVGAGKGSFGLVLQECDHDAWWCLEPDPALADEISELCAARQLSPSTRLVRGTIADLPADARFDTILYLDVLEHICDDAAEALRAAARLRLGGRVIVLAPAFMLLYSNFDRAIGHHRRYTRQSLDRIRPASLKSEAAFYLDAPGALLSLGNRLLLRSANPTLAQIRFWDRFVIPLARWTDPLLGPWFGRSLAVVWRSS
jgi:SAM-dependent methyltransferase